MPFPSHLLLPALTKLVILYPFFWALYNAIYCAPYGSLRPLSLQCNCPGTRKGRFCQGCNINPSRGKCLRHSRLCYDKWMGPNCTFCPAENSEDGNTCTGACDNSRGYYESSTTTKCIFCNKSYHCSGHGKCTTNGLCECDTGWTRAWFGLNQADCSIQCPGHPETCSGHGVCTAGGHCQCDEPYCGTSCEINLAYGDSPNYCNNMGFPTIPASARDGPSCMCECFKQNTQSVAYGTKCEHACPAGTNGKVCGESGIPYFNGKQCICQCPGGDRVIACDQSCQNGGTMNFDGTCDCPHIRQDPRQLCARCTDTNFHLPSLGCTAYCSDSVTCLGVGTCMASEVQSSVKCTNCPENHNGDIIDVIASTHEAEMDDSMTTIDLFVQTLAYQDLFRVIVEQSSGAVHDFTFAPDQNAVTIARGDSLKLTAPALYADKYVSQVLYAESIPLQQESVNTTLACMALGAQGCVAFSYSDMYRCINPVASECSRADKVILKSEPGLTYVNYTGTIPADGSLTFTIHEVLRRGCAECQNDHYPHPNNTGECNSAPCIRKCTNDESCFAPFGYCNKCGVCVCNNSNIDASTGCEECTTNYFPAPYRNASEDNLESACTTLCLDDALDGDPRLGTNSWYCSGHGECVGHNHVTARCFKLKGDNDNSTAECVPIDFVEGDATLGWTGDYCEKACNSNLNNTALICSGHGQCLDGVCSCNRNFAGLQCDATCSEQGQYFYVNGTLQIENDGGETILAPDPLNEDQQWERCDDDNPSSRCFKLKCNGGTCKPTHQYVVPQGDSVAYIFYQNCTSNNLDRCLPGESSGDNATRAQLIRQTRGIFCDVGTTINTEGICAKMVCTCGEGEISVTDYVNADGDLIRSRNAYSLGGEGCQYTGCAAAGFPMVTGYESMCGYRPPPAIDNALGKLEAENYNYDSFVSKWVTNLPPESQGCPQGQCVQSGTRVYSAESPAPAHAQAIQGVCECFQEPSRECDFSRPDWPSVCCTPRPNSQAESQSEYFGASCMDECICKQLEFGTCHDNSFSQLVAACRCREGGGAYDNSEGVYKDYRAALHCGPFCTTTCEGLSKNVSGEFIPYDTDADNLKDECEAPGKDKRDANCYGNIFPCSGHGWCASKAGDCIGKQLDGIERSVSRSFKGAVDGKCQCWGDNIPSRLNKGTLLPQTITLYGGDACRQVCPASDGEIYAYFEDNVEDLYQEDMISVGGLTTHVTKDKKKRYFQLYEKLVCSGRGSCDLLSAKHNDTHLTCDCRPNYAGFDCSQRCQISSDAWGTHVPGQILGTVFDSQGAGLTATVEGFNESSVPDALLDHFGLNLCGPNAQCGLTSSGVATCMPVHQDGHYTLQTYESAVQMVLRLTRKTNANEEAFQNFFRHWDQMFVGAYATCQQGYYSSRERNIFGIEKGFISDLPPIVRWQIKRSCDATYSANTWEISNGPWCCTYPEDGDAWKDDTVANYLGYTHGGCPDTYCSNFAIGRACNECISDAFESYYAPSIGSNTCPTGFETHGYCAKCSGTQMISPFKSLRDSNGQEYMVQNKHACERCISFGHTLSGEQIYSLSTTSHPVCNNGDTQASHGTCAGFPNTFSDVRTRPLDASLPASHKSLLCGNNSQTAYQLGLCQCNEGFEGPTCAMPTKDSSCGTDGIVAEISGASTSLNADGTPHTYKYCKCNQRTGFYCTRNENAGRLNFVTDKLLPCQTIQNVITGDNQGVRIVECNDPTGQTPCDKSGYCTTCADPSLDPYALCREYKAYGYQGIVQKHQQAVRERAKCAQTYIPAT